VAEEIVHGMRELAAKLLDFPEKLQRRSMSAVMRAGGRPVRDAARRLVSKRSGKLSRSIRVSVKRRGGKFIAQIIAGRARKKDDPFYALFVEKGTKAHEIRPKNRKSLFIAGLFKEEVKHPGAKPQPFLAPALKQAADAAVQAMQEELSKQIERIAGGSGGPL
jgi:HK97 gp10 family phage protein